jgi:hypothetical protein
VRITDADGDFDSRRCVIQVVMHPRAFVSASAKGVGPYESVEPAVERIRAALHRRYGQEAESTDVSRAA